MGSHQLYHPLRLKVHMKMSFNNALCFPVNDNVLLHQKCNHHTKLFTSYIVRLHTFVREVEVSGEFNFVKSVTIITPNAITKAPVQFRFPFRGSLVPYLTNVTSTQEFTNHLEEIAVTRPIYTCH